MPDFNRGPKDTIHYFTVKVFVKMMKSGEEGISKIIVFKL